MMAIEQAEALFARHLDLRPLRGRSRGVTHCPFHGADRHASLSVDLDRGLFNCFSCGAQGGARRFRELVGEAVSELLPPESDWDRAWRRIQQVNRRQADRAAAWAPWAAANDYVRRAMTSVASARRWAHVLGPEHPRTWPLLELAARAETDAHAAEAQLDALLDEGRLHLDSGDAVEPLVAALAGRP
jgi:hypothetical protein